VDFKVGKSRFGSRWERREIIITYVLTYILTYFTGSRQVLYPIYAGAVTGVKRPESEGEQSPASCDEI
jgi:hypothetical protein